MYLWQPGHRVLSPSRPETKYPYIAPRATWKGFPRLSLVTCTFR
jgi:hypothetical protein